MSKKFNSCKKKKNMFYMWKIPKTSLTSKERWKVKKKRISIKILCATLNIFTRFYNSLSHHWCPPCITTKLYKVAKKDSIQGFRWVQNKIKIKKKNKIQWQFVHPKNLSFSPILLFLYQFKQFFHVLYIFILNKKKEYHIYRKYIIKIIQRCRICI